MYMYGIDVNKIGMKLLTHIIKNYKLKKTHMHAVLIVDNYNIIQFQPKMMTSLTLGTS